MNYSAVLELESSHKKRPDALTALSLWTGRHILVAAVAALVVAVLIGLPSVLIPNPFFTRDIPTVGWNYPVWILTSILSGMLTATFVRTPGGDDDDDDGTETPQQRRAGRFGMVGGILAWFAVGCPVCNKLVLLAVGYSGALTWFAPAQPYLAAGGLALTAVALYWRLRGQVSCPVPLRREGKE